MSRYVIHSAPVDPGVDIQPQADIHTDPQAETDVFMCCIQATRHVAMAVSAGVNTDAFTDSRCRYLWPALVATYVHGDDPDVSVLMAEWERPGPLSETTKQWIRDLAFGLPMRSHFPGALSRLLEARRKRDLISAAHRIIEAARAGEPSGDIIAAAQKTLTDIGGCI